MLQITRRHRDALMGIVIGAGAPMEGAARNRQLSAGHYRQIKKPNSQKITEATFTPTSRGGAKLCHAGRIYRFRKNLAGWQMRWKCINAEWNSKCSGYAVTDGKVPGSVILRAGEHAPPCEPSAPMKEGAPIRHAVISTAGGSAGVTHVRAVAECLGGAWNSVTR